MTRSLRRKLRHTTLWKIIRQSWWEFLRWRHPQGRKVRLNGIVDLRVDPAVNLNDPHNPTYEKEFFTRFYQAIKQGDVILDIGANQGIYTIPAGKKVGKNGRVYPFEPSPAAIRVIVDQVRLNKLEEIVHPVQSVVGDAVTGSISKLYIASSATGWTSTKVRNPGTSPILVPGISIDEFCRTMDIHPHLIKIDVEGCEMEVLRGARKVLEKNSPMVFCALHTNKSAGDNPASFLEKLGYKQIYTQQAQGSDESDIEAIFSKDQETE